MLCILHGDALYGKAVYWLRPSRRVSAMWHIAEVRSTWNMPEIRHGLGSSQPMVREAAAVAAARLGRREGIEALVALSLGECLKISPSVELKALFGGEPGFDRYGWSTEAWWSAVRDRIRYVPGKAVWTVRD